MAGKGFDFDFLGEFQRNWNIAQKSWKIGTKWGRMYAGNRARERIREELGREVADAVYEAVAAGRDPGPIINRARKDLAARKEREALLANPPDIHGSAAWPTAAELTKFLRPREAFDDPRSILLGAFCEEDSSALAGFVHWDDDGHLMTLAPSRQGKALTTIIPNLLRYRGSVVVLDPKSELYEATSAWRRANVGPVYRIAPFHDDHDPVTRGFPRHRYNPLTRIRTQSDARSLAEQLFPRDPKAPEFFAEDAVAFVTALIMHILDKAPPERAHLAAVRQATALPLPAFEALVGEMAKSGRASVRDAANNVLGKDKGRGVPNLRDTLNTKFSMWSADEIQRVVTGHDFDFEGLKDRPATVYIDVPFDLIEPHAAFIRMLFKSALDAMLRNRTVPKIPVLFLYDEFLSLGPFPEAQKAIRTHAGAGVRFWFFLQNVGDLKANYPNETWASFFNCAVKQYFGIDDDDTAGVVSRMLGPKTVAYRSTNAGANVSVQMGNWETDGSAGVSFSSGETVQFTGRPLLTPDEVQLLLSGWGADGTRESIVKLRGPRAFKAKITVWNESATCRARIGAYRDAGDRTG